MEKSSGRISLRIPQTLHTELLRCAEKEGVSLNQYCLYILSKEYKISSLEDTIDSLDQTMNTVSSKAKCNEMSNVVFEEKIDRLERTVDKLQAFEIENLEQEVDNIKYEIDGLKTNLISAMKKLNSRIEKLEV